MALDMGHRNELSDVDPLDRNAADYVDHAGTPECWLRSPPSVNPLELAVDDGLVFCLRQDLCPRGLNGSNEIKNNFRCMAKFNYAHWTMVSSEMADGHAASAPRSSGDGIVRIIRWGSALRHQWQLRRGARAGSLIGSIQHREAARVTVLFFGGAITSLGVAVIFLRVIIILSEVIAVRDSVIIL